jgi:hypothetical protein
MIGRYITGDLVTSPAGLGVLAAAAISLAAVLVIPVLLGLALVFAAVISWVRAAELPPNPRQCFAPVAASAPRSKVTSKAPRLRLRLPAFNQSVGRLTG